MVNGCQTCLRVLTDPSDGCSISSAFSSLDEISIKDKLADCVPELLLDSTQDAILCRSCMKSLTLAYNFKQTCLEAQQKIYGYLQQMPLNTQINMGEIASYYKRLELVMNGGEPMTVENEPNEFDYHAVASAVKNVENCPLCEFSCTNKCTIRQHMILHNAAVAPYKCDECTCVYSTPEQLLEHLAKHTNEKPYSCTLCDVSTYTRLELNEHNCTHSKIFDCHICRLRFAQKQEVEIHLRTHSEKQKQMFYCRLCNYKCDIVTELEFHVTNLHQQTNNINQITSEANLIQFVKIIHKKHDETQNPDLNYQADEKRGKNDLEKTDRWTVQQTQMQMKPKIWKEVKLPARKSRQSRSNRKVRFLVGPNTFMQLKVKDAISAGLLPPAETVIKSEPAETVIKSEPEELEAWS